MIVEPLTRKDGKAFGRPTHWYEDATGRRVPGVTTILKEGLPAPALINWAGNVTAEYAVNNWADLTTKPVADRLKELKGCRFAERDAAARRGTEVHALGEQLVHGQQVEVPDELTGHVDAYVRFLDQWQPEPILTEVTVYHTQYEYAGTLDLVCKMNGATWLLDLKTGRSGVYGETALQLSAYRYAEKYLNPDGVATPMPPVDHTGVVWVRSDGYDLLPVSTGPETLTYFRHVAVVARRSGNLKELIGDPLTYSQEGAA